MSETARLIIERDEARANAERLWTTLAEQDNELEAAREDVLRLTSERDAARTEVRRLIAERDQPKSTPKGREVGRFGLDGHYLDGMEPMRPSDEDIWREVWLKFVASDDAYISVEKRTDIAEQRLAEYRKRWPR